MRQALIGSILVSFLLVGCQPAGSGGSDKSPPPPAQPAPGQIEIVEGQTIYVPVYSHVAYYIESKTYLLSATVSIRNTDPDRAISIESVDYYDSDGALVQHFVQQPVSLGPLASAEYFVPQADRRGGSGANFLVTWTAETAVHAPVVEAVMVGTSGTLGISFTSPGRVYRQRIALNRDTY